MAIRDLFKVSRKTFFNPTGWVDYQAIKEQNRTIWDILKGAFTVPKPTREETFTQAMHRLQLSEADVKNIAMTYRLYAAVFFAIGLVIFIYTLYLLFHHLSFTGFILGIASMSILLSQAFRYDFWSFQMRERKLGATFAEWKQSYLGKGTSK